MMKILLFIVAGLFAMGLAVIVWFIGTFIYIASGGGYTAINKKLSEQYYSKDGLVYFVQGGNFFELGARVIEGADLDSFKVLSHIYAKDSSSIFFLGHILEEANCESFEVLENYYARDKHAVYFYGKKLNGVDPDGFKVLDGTLFSKNNTKVLYAEEVLTGADADSFATLNSVYSVDSENLYFQELLIAPLKDHDISLYRNDAFLSIGSTLFYSGRLVRDDFDSKSFNIFSEKYFFANGKVYSYSFRSVTELLDSDADTFSTVGDYYGKDKNNSYYGSTLILNMPPHKLTSTKFEPSYKYRDLRVDGSSKYIVHVSDTEEITEGYLSYAGGVYHYFSLINEADVASFSVLTNRYSKDKSHIFYTTYVINDVDMDSFTVLDDLFSKDKNHVYYTNKKVLGASPETFVLDLSVTIEEVSDGLVRIKENEDDIDNASVDTDETVVN